MNELLQQLNRFLAKAMLATYAGDGQKVVSQRPGFKELEYREGPFYYRDSYTGFFTSVGQETVWYEDRPFWTQVYGGGMYPEYRNNEEFAGQTFTFLKKALSTGEKGSIFQPRGLPEFIDSEWKYISKTEGDIAQFKGEEKILYQSKPVFFHNFFGGAIKGR
jgi:hypothetical protein